MTHLSKGVRPVLADHKQDGKVFRSPLNQFPVSDAGWLNVMVPEFLWLRMLSMNYGAKRGAHLSLTLARAARQVRESGPLRSYAFVSAYTEFDPADWVRVEGKLGADEVFAIGTAVAPLAALSPFFPLASLVPADSLVGDLSTLRRALAPLYDRRSAESTTLQAFAMYLIFDAGQLSYGPDSLLQHFPEVQFYPKTELSRRVASVMRATLSGMVRPLAEEAQVLWPRQFWQSACEAGSCGF